MLPVLKWPGSKRASAAKIIEAFPAMLKENPKDWTVFEPFAGSAAVFFAAEGIPAKHWVLSDVNVELMNFYKVLQQDPQALIEAARRLAQDTSKEGYLAIRDTDVSTVGDEIRAARMLYLNKMAFNGIWRENAQGKHNVPYNNKPETTVVDEQHLLAASRRLQGVTLVCGQVEDVLEKKPVPLSGKIVRRRNIMVYLDPPYVPLSVTSKFTSYSSEGYSRTDQRRLADLICRLAEDGAYVLMSNSRTPETERTYNKCFVRGTVTGLEVRRVIAANASRPKVGELLASTYIR